MTVQNDGIGTADSVFTVAPWIVYRGIQMTTKGHFIDRLGNVTCYVTIVLGRHAKSDWSTGLPDRERPLNSRGKRDAPKMGALLAAYGFQPDLIMSSDAVRARTTAQIIAEKLIHTRPIRTEPRIYDEGHGAIVGLLQDLPEEIEKVMLFGHNPTMEMAAGFFLQSRAGIVIPTCALMCLESTSPTWGGLSPLNVSLKWFLIPRLFK